MSARRTLALPDPDATIALGRALAGAARAGDALLLSGPTGAGKSLLARALIQETQRAAGQPPEDVPSPTYTLVQTYAAGPLEIWHADLYRLSDPDELAELGLTDAWDTALTLIEWPDRLGALAPAQALRIDLRPSADGTAREAAFTGPASTLDRLLPQVPA